MIYTLRHLIEDFCCIRGHKFPNLNNGIIWAIGDSVETSRFIHVTCIDR